MAELDLSGLKPVDGTGNAGAPIAATAPRPSSQTPKLDLSGLKPFDPEDDSSGYASVAARGLARGATEGVASSLKGLSLVPDSGLGEAAVGNPGVAGDLQQTVEATPPTQRPIYRAGQAAQDFADQNIPMTRSERESLTGQVAQTIGAVAPAVGAAIAGGPAGIAIGAGQFAAQSAGDMFDRTLKSRAEQARNAAAFGGATPEEQDAAYAHALVDPEHLSAASKSAGMNAIIGGVMGSLPLGAILRPVARTAPGLMGWASGKLMQAAQSGITFAGIGEAQHWLGEQVAATYADPTAHYEFDPRRLVASLIAGGALGTVHPLSTPRQSTPGEINDFLNNADASGPQPPNQTAADINEFVRRRDAGWSYDDKTGQWTQPQPGAGLAALPPPENGAAAAPRSAAPPPQPGPAPAGAQLTPDYPSFEQSPTPAAPPVEPQGTDAGGRELLQQLFDDPRTAAEIRAEMDKRAAADAVNQPFTPGVTAAPAPAALDEPPAGPPEGSRERPVTLYGSGDVYAGAEQTAQPTPAQAEAGNYAKRHVRWEGLNIAIETEAGGERSGIGPDGQPWSVTLTSPYGYIKGTEGRDGDQVDVYLGPQPQSPHVFVVDQRDHQTGAFDEHKALIGFPNEASALAAYQQAFSDGLGEARIGAVTQMTVPEFKGWVRQGVRRNPIAYSDPVKAARSIIQEHGLNVSDDELHAAVRAHLDSGTDLTATLFTIAERAALADHHQAVTTAQAEGLGHEWSTDTTAASETGAGSPAEGQRPAEPEAAPASEPSPPRQQHDEAQRGAVEAGPRVLINHVGADGLTDAERAANKPKPTPAEDRAAEDKAARIRDRLQGVLNAFSADRNTPMGAARADIRGVIDVLRPHRLGADIDRAAILERAHSRLSLQYPHLADVLYDIIKQLRVPTKKKAVATPQVAPIAGMTPLGVKPAAAGENPEHQYAAVGGGQGYLERIPGENGTEAIIAKRADGKYAVTLRDTDADKSTGSIKIVDTYARASEEAQKLARGGQPPPSNEPQKSDVAEEAPKTGPSDSSAPEITLAHALLARLNALKLVDKLTAKEIQAEATKVYGSALAEGKFDRKDLTDALELAVNIRIRDNPEMRVGADGDWKGPMDEVESLLHHLPTQRVRSEEQESFQQFSTPPNYALAAAYAVNLHKGDVLLEPSAGTGSLVAAASMPGVKIIANELSERRAALLRELVGKSGEVITENAEQLNNILPDSVKPTVVLMNPPFSQTAGRLGDKKDLMVAANHIDQALARLEPGGRLVAIVGGGMVIGQPKYRAWFAKLMANNTLRANIGVDGKVYAKYGTSFYTRLLVIDKVKPQPGMKPETASVQSADELMRLLETIRDARPSLSERPAAEQHAVEPGGAVVAQERAEELRPGAPSSLRPATGGEGAGVGGQRGVGGPGPGRAGEPSDANVRVETGQRPEVAAVQPERPGAGRAGGDAGKVAAPRAQSEVGSGDRTQRDLQPATGGQSGAAARGQQLELEHAEPGSQAATEEISESLYDTYRPQRVRVPGAKAHPSKLVESAAMASVPPPKPTYQPHLPKAVISKGQLSEAQIEPVIYAGEAHGQMLPAQEGSKAKRKGFFIGDGTGVGKGREVAGIILDNFAQGRRKAVWVSEKKTLLQDAKRDWSGLGQNPNLLFDVGKVKTGEPVQAKEGVGFITYDTLKGGMSDQAALARGQFIRKQQVQVNGQSGKVEKIERNKKGDTLTVKLDNGTTITAPAKEVTALEKGLAKSRVDQLVDWFGEDFDGVIAFDEAHNMGNATDIKGERGQKDAAQKAIAGMALQDRLPNARVVYVSATGATEVSNLAYADRLGLWGRGTPFASREKFVTDVQKGGIAAMELIARDMKQLGLYTARNLSYDGVEYERVEHALDANQREIYNTLAEAWQHVLANINTALEATGGSKDSRAKSAAMSAFWGGHQRFFNQIVTSMQMPTVLKAVEKDIAEGRQVVLQLTNTNEASQERAAAKAQTAEDIEDLDITPRDQIIQLVEKSFPTQQYEQYVDDNGKMRARPVVDKAGNPVQNKEAVVVRDRLIEQLASVRVPQGPLDMILDHFGTDVVAEVTGRGRRFVRKRDEKTGEMRRVEESRPASSNIAETDAFQGGKKKILVFSEAGGTGRSYHADLTAASKGARRVHYLLQGGWRADKAVQGFGRSHRSNQASAPIFKLVTTDLKGQKRFISSIARRLGQLGALTKGQRQAGDQGIFSARDNLESTEANRALDAFFRDLLADKIEGVTVKDFEKQTGLKLRNEDDEGRVSGGKMEMPPVTQFLNRLLSLKVDFQNKVFDAFSDRLDAVIEARRQAGLLDVGLETVKADKIGKVSEQTVHTVKGTDADTKYVKIALSDKFVPVDFETLARNQNRPVKAWVKSPNDKVYAVTEAPDITDENGAVFANYRVTSPVSGSRMIHRINIDRHDSKWSKIDRDQAKSLWGDETAQAPKYVTRDMHLITGAILPIWDRLSGNPRVVRLQTDKGERFIGRVVPNDAIATTLKALGAENKATNVSPVDLYAKLRQGGRVKLANGWMLQRSLVAGEHRIELKGPSSFSEGQEAKQDGAFTEKIDYKLRYFVPMDNDKGPEVLRKLTEYRPVTDVSDAASAPDDMAAGEGPMFALRPGATDSPQFKRWFGKSKVVDADGKPMVVYHGTNGSFDRFSKDKLGSATGARSAKMGFFFTDNTDLASSYADNENPYERLPVIRQVNGLTRGKYQNFNEAVLRALGMESQLPSGQSVMPVYLRITNPLEVDFDGEGASSDKPYSEIIAKAKAAGHDGVFIRGTMDPGFSEYAGGKGGAYQPSDLFIAFDPAQIKSASGNSGAFDANNPRIDMAVRAGPLTMRGAGAVEARGSFTGDLTAHAKAIGGLLRAELDRLGLKDIGLNLVDRLEIWMKGERAGTADGVYFEKAITLALDGGDKFKILHHEALHALRSLGLFKDTEYAILAQQSQRTWRKQFKIDEGYGNRSEDTKTEEGITHAYAAWANGEMKVDGRMARLFKRIRDFLEALRNAFRGNGFKTAEDVFRDIKSGKVGGRAREGGKEEEPQFSMRSTAVPTPKLDARIREGIANALDWAKPKANKFIEGMQDLSHPMKLLQQDLEIRRAAAFDDPENFYQRKRLYPGRLGAWVDSFNKRHLDGIVKLLKANGVDLKDAGDVLYAMHAPERNAEMGKINENLEAGSGMSDEEAAKIIADAKASGQWPAYEDLRDRVAAVRELILTVMERAGLEKPEVIADWRKTYNDYVPLRGWEEAPDDAPPNYGPASGFNIRGKEVKRAYGRRSKADNPLVNLFDQAYRTFDRAERNRYLQSVYRALDNVGEDASDIAKLDKGKPKKSIDPKTGMVRTTETSPLFNDPNAVFLKFDGNPHFIVFKDRDLAEATKRMSPAGIGAFEGLLKFQNKMKALWTHYSPDFLLRHFLFRYPIEGTLNSFEQKESGDHKVSQYVKDAIPFLGDASKAIFASQKGVTHDNPRIAAMQKSWEEMRRAGGAMVFRNMRDVDLLREHLETALKDLSKSPVANARAKWRHMVEAMDAVTNALDNSLRLAAFASARKQGKTPEQAALIAREATVDFQLKGNFAKGMGLFFVFGNVAVQTAARISKAAHRSKMMRRVFMGTMLASFLLGAYNYLMGGEDKDGVPFFEKIPEWERRLNLIILNPFDKDAKGRPQPIKIPLPYNWAFPVVLGYLMATSIFGKESVRKRLAMFTKSAMETFTPMGSEENKVAAVTPELARPFVHTYTNEDWAGRPIHSDDHYQKGPNAYSPRRNTGEGWKKFAEILNSASGGSRGKSGLVDLYPEDYRELIDHFIGTQIRLGSNTYDTLGSIMKGEAPKATTTPLGRVIYGTDYDAADRARGYELRDQRKHPWKAH